LILYYNKDILQAANESPPTSWAQLGSLATKLTLKEGSKIKRSGVALGTAENTDHFSDILATLMLQNGADLTQPNSPEVRDALIYYTNFVKSTKVWDETMPNSVMAFARGEAAMMLAPSWRAHEIRGINPELKFATAPLPQVTEDNVVTWGTYWAEGVNKRSKHADEAWEFLRYLVDKDVEKDFFASASKVRMFGEPYARVDLASELADDPILGSLMSDAPKADSWYMCSNTFDNGINHQIIKYYKDAVNAILSGKSIEKVLPTLDQGVKQVLSQYDVTN
jgi:multiple sugar transport system substrate-binding protein